MFRLIVKFGVTRVQGSGFKVGGCREKCENGRERKYNRCISLGDEGWKDLTASSQLAAISASSTDLKDFKFYPVYAGISEQIKPLYCNYCLQVVDQAAESKFES